MTQPQLTETERKVIEAVGDLISFWSFSKHYGRIWALLYVRREPFSSPEIQELLDMSAGLVSMSLKELQHWDVVQKVWVQGDRKDYYTANIDLWHMVTRVVREREYHLLENFSRNLDEALGDLETTEPTGAVSEERIEYMKPRVQHLLEVSESFALFLNFLLTNAEASVSELQKKMETGPPQRGTSDDQSP